MKQTKIPPAAAINHGPQPASTQKIMAKVQLIEATSPIQLHTRVGRHILTLAGR